jgi:hypothetical protein
VSAVILEKDFWVCWLLVMRPMILHDLPPFAAVVQRLSAAEHAINST